ncbi:aspartate carbamoyltransferase [Denitrovibrio acetiphilus DSM 12809]|uniref:Aspartate carbamoyltransferase n=1 Tax=Denitrovibrio acetiphilus (strain DSM 12809 / NBRC 114555 / N2460) TaxID=522772 RepID=D4H833_DENA2|nr:aspartate carbamoyltransferase catalytic subunit [Denitrovibrio acetiphilus]ADD68182.1 aspartate carbamoyltransferase [Denitrovibrio acetiphilus DSM 12809]
MSYNRKDLLGMSDLSAEEITYLLDTAQTFCEINERDVKKVPTLKGRTVINVFFEPSTRTRTSFEIAGKRLSADTINFTASSSSTTKGETLIDTVKNMEAMHSDVFVVRHSYSGAVKLIAENTDTAVVNAGDGLNEHPTQALLDLLTIRQRKGKIKGLEIAIIGDITHSRVARSDIWAMNKLGANVRVYGPLTMLPKYIAPFNCRKCTSMEEALEGADVIIMLRIQHERQGKLLLPSTREYAKFFGLTNEKLEIADKDAIVMHPGPINRGVELMTNVADCNRAVVLDQVSNGVAVRMAALYLLGNRKGGKIENAS